MGSGGPGDVEVSDVLDAFDSQSDPETPLTADEVADAVGCSSAVAAERLGTLVDRGDLATKAVGSGTRVWWRPANYTRESSDRRFSEEVIELVLRSERLAEPIPATVDDVTVGVDSTASLPDGTRLLYLTVEGVDPRPFVDALEAFPDVDSVRLLRNVGESVSVEVAFSTDTVLTAVERYEGEIGAVRVDDGALEFTVELPGDADADEVLEAVRAASPDVELVTERMVLTPRLIRGVVAEDLTDRQLTVLQMAYFSGYFDVPRTTTGETLADQLEIAPQTFHAHLRKAQDAVFERVFERPVDDGATGG